MYSALEDLSGNFHSYRLYCQYEIEGNEAEMTGYGSSSVADIAFLLLIKGSFKRFFSGRSATFGDLGSQSSFVDIEFRFVMLDFS